MAEGRRINLTLYNFDIGSSPGGRTTITNENLIDSKEDTDLSQVRYSPVYACLWLLNLMSVDVRF